MSTATANIQTGHLLPVVIEFNHGMVNHPSHNPKKIPKQRVFTAIKYPPKEYVRSGS